MKEVTIIFAFICTLSFGVTAMADVPQKINYQGRLTDAVGNPLDTTVSILFTMYDAPLNPANVLWAETLLVTAANGLFDALLGSVHALTDTVFCDTNRYLGIKIGSDAEITTRCQMVTVPYAFRLGTLDGATGGTISGSIGIDVANPEGKLDVAGPSIFRREDGIHDMIVFGVSDPNVALELRSGTSGGTPYIDFANDDAEDFDARIRLREDGLLAVEAPTDANLQIDGHLRVDRTQSLDGEPSEGLDVIRSYYDYRGSAGSPYTYQGSVIRARLTMGGGGTNPVGTGHGITSESVMLESGDSRNEMTPLYLGCIAHTPCRLWGVDLNVHGPVNSQADLIQGLVNLVNNYNGDPVPNKGIGMAIVTRPGAGGSTTPEQQIGQTYPLDAGLAIVGYSGMPGGAFKTPGFLTALQIGGSGSGWMQEPETSRIGTGILITEIETAGIRFEDFWDALSPALSIHVPNVMEISESGTPKWRLSQEGSGANAALLMRDLTEADEWWWGCMAGGDKRLSLQYDRMVVMRDGRVGIGTPTPDNILTVVQSSPTDPIADAWTTYSSRRWKKNIAPIPDALDKATRLTGVCFQWKDSGKRDIGLIAEEVGEILPEVVVYEEDGINAKSIDYGRITALLVEALKEQQRMIEQLQAQVETLLPQQGDN